MMIVVLSQSALESEYVRYEYERGHKLGKRIVTVRCEEFYLQQPPEFSGIQFVDFMGKSGASYENALRVLIDGCQNPPPHQITDPHLLYQQAHDLEGSDAERAASVYQRLLIRNPQYASGEAQLDFERLNQRLYPQRVRRLRAQAELAHLRGAYGAEAGALRALIALGDQDRATFEWAQEYLRIAEENSQQMDLYDYIQKLVNRGGSSDLADAHSKLETLWQKARFFRDPAGVAPALGLADKVPMTYEEWEERRRANEAKVQREQEGTTERDTLIALTQSRAKASTDEENTRWELVGPQYIKIGATLVIITSIIAIVVGLPFINRFLPSDISGACLGVLVLSALITITGTAIYANYAMKNGDQLIIELMTPGVVGHLRRLSTIESEEQRLTSEARAQYQQRMAEIAAEHARTFAEIEARYPN